MECQPARQGRNRLAELIASYRTYAPKLAAWLEETTPEELAVFTLPEPHRRRLRPSSPMERSVQQELKRRTVKVRVCLGDDAPLRLVNAVLVEIDEKMGFRHEGPHQVGMPGYVIRSQQNFQTAGCSIVADVLPPQPRRRVHEEPWDVSLPILNPHICSADRESKIKPHGNPHRNGHNLL